MPERAAIAALAATLLVLGATPLELLEPPPEGGPLVSVQIVGVQSIPSGVVGSPLTAGSLVHLSLTLMSRNASGLRDFTNSLQNPVSPEYHRYLSEQGFHDKFGPPPANVSMVRAAVAAAGAPHVAATADGFGVSGTLGVAAAESWLGVRIESYRNPFGSLTYGVEPSISLPPGLHGEVVGLNVAISEPAGPSRETLRLPSAEPSRTGPREFVRDPSSGTDWFIGSDYATAYHVTGLFPGSGHNNSTFATPVAAATILFSGYNDTLAQDLPPFDPAAVSAYFNDTFAPSWPHPTVQAFPVTVQGITPPPAQAYGTVNDSSGAEEENSLDLEMVGSMAPGAVLANFYFAGSLLTYPSSTGPPYGQFADAFATALSAALSHNYSPARLAVVSNSFGLPDLNDSLWNQELLHAAAIGVTIVGASGDQANAPDDVSGRDQGAWPGWPASVAFNDSGVVSVGGVTLAMDGTPAGTTNDTELNATYDPGAGSISGQTAWYDSPDVYSNASGTEGGLSSTYTEPFWQFHSAAQPAISNASIPQGARFLGRAAPDVAFPANATVAYVAASQGTVFFDILGGTSIAAPVFAGELAEISAVAGHTWGFLDPLLYRMASYYAAFPSASSPLLDVTSGGNYVYQASSGWDPTTGWGGIDAVRFLDAAANPNITGYQYQGPTPGLPQIPSGLPNLGELSDTGVAAALILAAVVLGVLVTIVVAVWRHEEAQRNPPGYGYSLPPPPDAAAPLPAPAGASPAMFACPYCGWPRPAEPVRCPTCGRL